MSSPSSLLPFQPAKMSGAQLVAVSYLARYSGAKRNLYAYQLREWFAGANAAGSIRSSVSSAVMSSSTSASLGTVG